MKRSTILASVITVLIGVASLAMADDTTMFEGKYHANDCNRIPDEITINVSDDGKIINLHNLIKFDLNENSFFPKWHKNDDLISDLGPSYSDGISWVKTSFDENSNLLKKTTSFYGLFFTLVPHKDFMTQTLQRIDENTLLFKLHSDSKILMPNGSGSMDIECTLTRHL